MNIIDYLNNTQNPIELIQHKESDKGYYVAGIETVKIEGNTYKTEIVTDVNGTILWQLGQSYQVK